MPPPFPSSWYAATATSTKIRPPLTEERRVDVAVIGGGFTGLSTALELAQRGYGVALLEAGRVGWGASGRNGGQIVSAFNMTQAGIAKLVGRHDAARLWTMAEEAKRLIADRVAMHHIDCDLRWGYLFTAARGQQIAEIEAMQEDWESAGYEASRIVSRQELRALVASERYHGGLEDRGGGQLHPLNYALGLARAAEQAGAHIYEGSAVLRLEPGPPAILETAGGRLIANHVALAGNAYLPDLDPRTRAMRARIMPVITHIAATEPLAADLAASLTPFGHAVADLNFVLNYYRVSADGRMLWGGGATYSGRDPANVRRRLHARMAWFFPQLRPARIDYCWGGAVAITLNRLPDFGRLAPHIFYAQGFSGHGVALTGMAGRLMAEAIAGTAERFDVFTRLPHQAFPGGRRMRTPLLVLAMAWYRLRDLLW